MQYHNLSSKTIEWVRDCSLVRYTDDRSNSEDIMVSLKPGVIVARAGLDRTGVAYGHCTG